MTRWVQYVSQGERRLGFAVGDRVADLAGVRRAMAFRRGHRGARLDRLVERVAPRELSELLALGDLGTALVGEAQDWLAGLGAGESAELVRDGVLRDLASLSYAPAVSPTATVYCVGFNYAAHAAEAGASVSAHPELFIRGHESLAGHGQPIVRPAVSEMLDFEAELAVVIGTPCHRVAAPEARSFVAGYANLNEGSIRDYQKHSPFPTAGKNFPASGSMGPWVVTADEVPDPQDLTITTTVDGEVLQSAHTSDMIFAVDALVAYISEFTVLQPGDVISTGTPSGIGFRRTPQRFLRPGETVAVEFSGLGRLENPIVAEPDTEGARA